MFQSMTDVTTQFELNSNRKAFVNWSNCLQELSSYLRDKWLYRELSTYQENELLLFVYINIYIHYKCVYVYVYVCMYYTV